MNRFILLLVCAFVLLLGHDAQAKQLKPLIYLPVVSAQFGIPTPEYIVQASGGKTSHKTAQHIIRSVVREAKKAKLNPEVVFRIIEIESHYKQYAVSSAGAKGLMQVLPSAHPEKIKGKNLFDIDTNIQIGIAIYKEIQKRQLGNSRLTVLQTYAGAPGGKHYSKKYQAVKWSYDLRSKHIKQLDVAGYNERQFFASLGIHRAGAPVKPVGPSALIAVIALNGRY